MISVVVVADIPLYRDGIAQILSEHERIEVVATASRADEAVEKLLELAPRVVLVDRAMRDSLAAIRRIRNGCPGSKILALAVEEVDTEVIRYAEAGISGYVPRDASPEDVVRAIEAAESDELRCSPRVARTLLRHVRALSTRVTRSPTEALTERELEVLSHIERGCTNKRIASLLGIELPTVKNHVHNILEKLNVGRRGEAAALFRRTLTGGGMAGGGLDLAGPPFSPSIRPRA